MNPDIVNVRMNRSIVVASALPSISMEKPMAQHGIGRRRFVAALHGSDSLMSAGMTGPVTLRTAVPIDQETPSLDPRVVVDSTSIERGETLRITGEGFAPSLSIEAEFHSEPAAIGSAVANEDGIVEFEFIVPEDAALGIHEIILMQPESDLSAATTISVVARTDESAPTTDTSDDSDTSAFVSKPKGLSRTGSMALALIVIAGAFDSLGAITIRKRGVLHH